MDTNVEPFPKTELDAKTFQYKLGSLTDTIAYKVQREGHQRGLKPDFVPVDIYFQLRMAHQTYNLFFYMNHDERRQKDCDWKVGYSAVILPLVRTMIDCLYNVTAILQDPPFYGRWFRLSGFRYFLEALDADEKRYGGQARWVEYVAKYRGKAHFEMRRDGISEAEARASEYWLTLSRYVWDTQRGLSAKHQDFLKTLTLGFWKEYSGISHATFNGLLPLAMFLTPNDLRHEDRPIVDKASEGMISLHISRVAAILLCMLTEVQCSCHFEQARINQRLHEIWNVLIVIPEIKDLYDERYANLMKEKGINPE
jgi:hypothetical protein